MACTADIDHSVDEADNRGDNVTTSSDEHETPVRLPESSSRSTEVRVSLTDNQDETDREQKVCTAVTNIGTSKENNLDEDMSTPVMSRKATDTHEPHAKMKLLSDLNVAEVTAWLQSVRLDKAFGDEFAEQLIDGECLAAAEETDLERSGRSNKRVGNSFSYVSMYAHRFPQGSWHALEEILVRESITLSQTVLQCA